MSEILKNLKILLTTPDLASKKWVYEQYDSQVMNDTIYTKGDAAIVRVHGTNKALALTSDCTPRYVGADPLMGAKQAVAETYRNISAVGGKPMAITNCLNFGNPQKPQIMGQIVRAIQGINEACKELDYPVVSGNVSLYNETDGQAILPTPTIGGVGLLQDLNLRCSLNFKNEGDVILLIGQTRGHIGSSLFEREILKIEEQNPPPPVDLALEKKHSQFVRNLIGSQHINACHDISDGGLLVALFEMCTAELGFTVNLQTLENATSLNLNHLAFGEDQGRYLITSSPEAAQFLTSLAKQEHISLLEIGQVNKEKIKVGQEEIAILELQKLNQSVFEEHFS